MGDGQQPQGFPMGQQPVGFPGGFQPSPAPVFGQKPASPFPGFQKAQTPQQSREASPQAQQSAAQNVAASVSPARAAGQPHGRRLTNNFVRATPEEYNQFNIISEETPGIKYHTCAGWENNTCSNRNCPWRPFPQKICTHMAKEGFCYAHPKCGNALHVVQGTDDHMYIVDSRIILKRSKAKQFAGDPESAAASEFRRRCWSEINEKKKQREERQERATIRNTVFNLALKDRNQRAVLIAAEMLLQVEAPSTQTRSQRQCLNV
jgi:hypothetical protein